MCIRDSTFASGSRVLDILEEEPLVEEIKDEKEVSFNGAKAENVTFAYKDEIIPVSYTHLRCFSGQIGQFAESVI